jgi:hypothetical protein
MQLELPSVGSVLFIGWEQQYQSYMVRDLAGQCLAAGGSAIYLTDYSSEGGSAESAMADWLKAKGIGADAMDRFSTLDNVRQYRTADDLQARIEHKSSRTKHKPVVIVRDLGCATLQTLPGASWLGCADELALLMDCVVLSAGHWGPEPQPPQDALRYKADITFVCRAGNSLTLTLRRVKPTDATIKLKGKVAPYGAFLFDNVPEEGFSHVA